MVQSRRLAVAISPPLHRGIPEREFSCPAGPQQNRGVRDRDSPLQSTHPGSRTDSPVPLEQTSQTQPVGQNVASMCYATHCNMRVPNVVMLSTLTRPSQPQASSGVSQFDRSTQRPARGRRHAATILQRNITWSLNLSAFEDQQQPDDTCFLQLSVSYSVGLS